MPRNQKDGYYEFCLCGGFAYISHYEERIAILQCVLCGAEFEASEEAWR